MRTLLLSAALLLLGASSGHADLSVNFNSENGGVGVLNYTSFADFFVANSSTTGGTVDLIGNGFFDFYPGSGLYVDLDGSGNGTPGLLTTNQAFSVGTYLLSFDLGGSARGIDEHVNVAFGDYAQTFFLPSDQGLTHFTETVTLTTSAQLSFQNVEPGDIGAILDNVSVIKSLTAVPEPSTLCLAGFGAVCGIAHVLTRKRRGQHKATTEA